MIKLGVPNKGRLSDKSLDLVLKAGFCVQPRERALSAFCENFAMEVVFIRARDIPKFIQDGFIDLGITGQDLVRENGADVETVLELDFGRAELVFAAPKEFDRNALPLKKVKIATSYPQITQSYCDFEGIFADIIPMSGAVELAPKLGLSDAVVDLASSGETLKMNGLFAMATILETRACLFANRNKALIEKRAIDHIATAFQSVLAADEQKLVLANLPKNELAGLTWIATGVGDPIVMPILGKEDLYSIRVIVNKYQITGVVNQLKQIGASGILVVNIEQMVS